MLPRSANSSINPGCTTCRLTIFQLANWSRGVLKPGAGRTKHKARLLGIAGRQNLLQVLDGGPIVALQVRAEHIHPNETTTQKAQS